MFISDIQICRCDCIQHMNQIAAALLQNLGLILVQRRQRGEKKDQNSEYVSAQTFPLGKSNVLHFINQKVPCHAVYKILLVFSTFPASSSSFFTSFLFSFGFNYFVLKALTDSDPYRTGKRQFCADGPDFLKQ